MNVSLVCETCQKKYPSSEPIWRCECGGFLSVKFKAQFPLDEIKKRQKTMWRYREAIPIKHDSCIISFQEGFTPLVRNELNGKTVFFKQEYLFPTGSFKDRGASVLVSKIHELGIKRVVEDSSGNAGAAIAAYCTQAGILCDIYVPKKTSPGKLMNIKQYGATVHEISGTREDASEAVWHVAQTTYYASHYWNPFFVQGVKTFVFEIVEQLGWKSPDTLILPVGNGTLLLGAYLGLQELQNNHIIDSLPKLIGVQAENCSPLWYATKNNCGRVQTFSPKQTIAEGIAISKPVRINDIVKAIQKTNGMIITVNEQEITDALTISRKKGFFIEPTSAAAVAGCIKYNKADDEIVVVPLTGGKKTVSK